MTKNQLEDEIIKEIDFISSHSDHISNSIKLGIFTPETLLFSIAWYQDVMVQSLRVIEEALNTYESENKL